MRQYPGGVFGAHLVAESFNTIVQVDQGHGAARALRISPQARIHLAGTEDLEASWLEELRADTTIDVPSVHRNVRGEVVTHVSAPTIAGGRTCVLFSWVPGVPLRQQASGENMRRAGGLLAELHDQAASRGDHTPLRGAAEARSVLQFEIDDRLVECRQQYGTLLDDAREIAQEALDELWANPPHHPHLLHGDLSWDNVLVGESGQLSAIDFQDLQFGFAALDLVNAVYPLEHTAEGPTLGDAFRTGYTEVRPWPLEDPELFAALVGARRVMQVNLSLNLRKPGLDEHIARHARLLERWLEQGPDPEIHSRFTQWC
jgi:Ser/Thr protein kinase RdoA (MazF antagonist)